MRRWSYGLLVLLLPALALAADWKEYQRQYQQQLPQQRALREEVVENPELGIRERCMSCHLGVKDPRMRAAAQPLRTHPGVYLKQHPPREFGCTSCHGGRGDALAAGRAHGAGTREALLRGDLIQTRCGRCHQDRELEGAPALSHGYALIQKLGCTGCHALEGFQTQGPPCPKLAETGSKVNYKWLERWLQNPRAFSPTTTMPDFHLNDEQAGALAAYLMNSKKVELETLPEPPEGDPDEGGNLLRVVRCISCHAFNGKGGHLAPDLGRVGNKVDPKWLFYMLGDTRTYMPGTTMPQFNLGAAQRSDVVAYLLDEYTDYDLLDEYERDSRIEKRGAESIDAGRRIYKELRCANCHAHSEDEKWLQLAPVLSYIGDKKAAAFDFGHSEIPRTTADFIFEKIRHPRAFATESNLLKMPDFHLSDEEAKDITLALLASTKEKVRSPRYRVSAPLPSVYQPAGKAGELIEKYQCFSCHTIKGRGYNLAYDLSIEGSRVRPSWLYDYLMLSYSMRPILVERMPVFHFPAAEGKVLTDYIAKELTSAQIPADLESRLTPEMAARGKQLLDQKGCMACHIAGEKGGYVGPSFTIGALSGDKLRAGWIYYWLKDPQAVLPGVIEPNYQLSDAEIGALTAYLTSLHKEKQP